MSTAPGENRRICAFAVRKVRARVIIWKRSTGMLTPVCRIFSPA
jgi:hypothetical protein